MSDLSPAARALLDTSKKALRPTSADCERIEAALRLRLPDTELPQKQSSAPAARGSTWPIIATASIGVCLFGVVPYFVMRPEAARQPALIARSASPESAATAAAPTRAEPQAPTVPQPMAAQKGLPAPPRAAGRASAQPGSGDRLARELELLSRATRALRAGEAGAALQALEEHQRKFPHGVLRLERAIAKAQALCGLGRVQEGRAELARLPPGTPATARARQSCER